MRYKLQQRQEIKKKMKEKYKTVPVFIEKYFLTLESEKSRMDYYGKIVRCLNWLMENGHVACGNILELIPKYLNEVKHVDILAYLESLELNGLMDATIKNHIHILSSFWRYLVESDFVKKNIVALISSKRYQSPKKEVSTSTEDELNEFVNNLREIKNDFVSLRNITIVNLFLASGIRVSELVGLDLCDLYLFEEKPCIVIMEKGTYKYMRKVSIDPNVVSQLKQYLTERSKFVEDESNTAVFISTHKKRVTDAAIRKFFKEYSNNTIHPHKLRHTFGTAMYVASNYNIHAVSQAMGHKSIEITSQAYISNKVTETVFNNMKLLTSVQ